MGHEIAIVVVVALCTLLTRAFPFFLLGNKKEIPQSVQYLGKVLLPAIMVLLVVYCFKGVSFGEGSRGIPELLAVAVVSLLHIWKRNTLLSIGAGTVFYMFLVQVVF